MSESSECLQPTLGGGSTESTVNVVRRLVLAVWMALLVASPALGVEPQYGLELDYRAEGVAVIATVDNPSRCTLTVVGPWRYRVGYVPDEESAMRIAHMDSVSGTERYSRWEGVHAPTLICMEGAAGAWNERRGVPPGSSLCDTLVIPLSQEDYAQWPGWIEVEYYLKHCAGGCELNTNPAASTAETVLIARIPVPRDGT